MKHPHMCSKIASEPYLTPCIIQNKEEHHLFFHQMKFCSVRLPECSIAGRTAHNPYNWYTRWKCTLTRSIRSPFAPFGLKPCFLQMERNSVLVHSCILPLCISSHPLGIT